MLWLWWLNHFQILEYCLSHRKPLQVSEAPRIKGIQLSRIQGTLGCPDEKKCIVVLGMHSPIQMTQNGEKLLVGLWIRPGSEIVSGSAEFRVFSRIFGHHCRRRVNLVINLKGCMGGLSQELLDPQKWFTYQRLQDFTRKCVSFFSALCFHEKLQI